MNFKFLTILLLGFTILIVGGAFDSWAQMANAAKTPTTNVLCNVGNILSGDRGKTIIIVIISLLGLVLLLSKLNWGIVILMVILGGLIFGAKDMISAFTNNGSICVDVVATPEEVESLNNPTFKDDTKHSIVEHNPSATKELPEIKRSSNKCKPVPPEYSDRGYAAWCEFTNEPWFPSWLRDDICLKYYWCYP